MLLQKKSALQAKDYQTGLTSLLKLVDPSTIINPESVSRYYSCPTMMQLIENVQGHSKDFSPISCIAAAYLIDQWAKLKLCGTIGTMASLWAYSATEIKSATTELDRIISGDSDIKKKIEDSSKLMINEVKQNKTVTLIQKRFNPKNDASTKTGHEHYTVSATIHPLTIFNCSFSGPSFGPILYQ